MRHPIRLGALILVFLLIGAACGSTDTPEAEPSSTTGTTTTTSTTTTTATAAPATTTSTVEEIPIVTVNLVDYPWWDNAVLAEAPDRLDALAQEYADSIDGDPEMERFLFGQMPVFVFDDIFAGAGRDDLGELFWLLHLSGYFGGRWLRGEIADAQPDALLVGFSNPPTEAAFLSTVASAQARLDLLDGDEAAILGAARAALFDRPPVEDGGDPVRGLADSFGYNVGYLLEILATPPEGIVASPDFDVTCDGLFDCSYASPKLAVLADLAELQAAINADPPAAAELGAELRPVQDAAEPRGRGVWSGGLSVQGFSQESYDQLIDVSSSFLETVQATALTNVGATMDSDSDAARRGIIAEAAQIVWLDAYIAGLTNGEGEIELPSFS